MNGEVDWGNNVIKSAYPVASEGISKWGITREGSSNSTQRATTDAGD